MSMGFSTVSGRRSTARQEVRRRRRDRVAAGLRLPLQGRTWLCEEVSLRALARGASPTPHPGIGRWCGAWRAITITEAASSDGSDIPPLAMAKKRPPDHERKNQSPAPPCPDANHFPIVGIGASAGGLAALKTLLSHVPDRTGVAFVVVVHLSPEHESRLADLLQQHCKLPVQQVSETVKIEPDCVYVIPPNANLNTIDTHLRLSELEPQRRDRATIDHFFRTLAETHNRDAVGVVLTGTGSDGTLGLQKIREAGGLTIVQDPAEAEHDGMPRSAIASGMVDLVLPLREIPVAIVRCIQTRPLVPVLAEGDSLDKVEERGLLLEIFAQIRGRTGQDFSRYKPPTILRRIQRRMQLKHVQTLADYLNRLREDRDEVLNLFNDLLITVTRFFRDENVYARLEQSIVPGLFEGKSSDDRIRVWSVGCSTGEEAYSLAMLLLEEADRRDVRPELQVFASDLHEFSLAKARDGLYAGEISGDVSPERLRRYFTSEDGHYRVRREVRDLVVFAAHNLLRDPPFSHIDLIVCRNLLIYLQRDAQHDVISLFHYALEPQGLLLLGTSEAMDRVDLFHCEDKEVCLYRKRDLPADRPWLPVFPLRPPANSAKPAKEGWEHTAPPASYGSLHERMAELYAPPSVLVTARHEVVHSSAHAGRYLNVPGGHPTRSVFKLVREPLQLELQSALHIAGETGRATSSKPIPIEIDGQPRRVVLRVHPAKDADPASFFLIIFDELPDEGPATGAPSAGHEPSVTARELEMELELNRKRLQGTIEEHESSREEMRAANEELQSTNEELRSTMEELETSKEELQSTNEELTTLNQENRHRVEELAQLSADLQNLMTATDIATLFLDRELRIVRFTPAVTRLFNVRQSDRGRPLSDLTHRLGYTHLADDALLVLDRLVPVEREIKSESGHWYLTRVLPYRSAEDRIVGVVLTFVDISDRKRAEVELHEAKVFAESIVETLHEPLLVLNPDFTVQSVNAAFLEHFQAEPARTIGYKFFDLGNGQWNIPALRELLEHVLPTNKVFSDYEVQHDFETLGHRTMLVNGRRLDHVQLILLGLRDITDRKRAEEELRQIRNELEQRVVERTVQLEAQTEQMRRLARKLSRAEHEERKRLADHLHDDLQQLLVAALMRIGALEPLLKDPEARELLENIRDMVQQVSASSRDLTRQLRPPVLYEAGLVPALDWLATEMRRLHGLDVALTAGRNELRLNDDVASLLFESVRELLLNVVKHAGAREAAVDVRMDESCLRVRVSDEGGGFDASEQHAETSGLGLLSVRDRVAALGGGVTIDSSRGEGTTIELAVPLEAVGGDGEPPLMDREPMDFGEPPAAVAGQIRVLVVDDHAVVRLGIARLLNVDGRYVVVGEAGDGAEALRAVDVLQPDVVLMDVNMPRMNGIEATRAIRHKHPDLPVIALSFHEEEDMMASMIDAGASSYVRKGGDASALFRIIDEICTPPDR